MLVLDSAVHEVSCFWGGWRTSQPSTGCPACNDYPESLGIWLDFNCMAHFSFASVSREHLETKLLYSWWSFVGLRTGAFSLALFCISLVSFLQDTQSKRRIGFQHGRSFPVKWMFILGKNGTFTLPENQHIPPMGIGNSSFERSYWMGYVSSQEGRYPPNFLEQTGPIFDPQSWSQILKGSSGQ